MEDTAEPLLWWNVGRFVFFNSRENVLQSSDQASCRLLEDLSEQLESVPIRMEPLLGVFNLKNSSR